MPECADFINGVGHRLVRRAFCQAESVATSCQERTHPPAAAGLRSGVDADRFDPARLAVVVARDDDAFEPDAAFGGLEPDG